MGHGAPTWNDVVSLGAAKIRSADRGSVLAQLGLCGHPSSGRLVGVGAALRSINSAALDRLLYLCPCLYAQLDERVSARGVVHLCEVTLNCPIDSGNVYSAFQVQHPSTNPPTFAYPPLLNGASGGDIMEALCSEVLTNHGVPHMDIDSNGWPIWDSDKHLSLNIGKMRDLKLYGDILIPAAPHNILVSVKSEAARERFVVSGNRLESIGFGFFNDASEFWTKSRMNLLKRWGFTAIYMPSSTLAAINSHIVSNGTQSHAININGRPLYRDLAVFGSDVIRVAGKISMDI